MKWFKFTQRVRVVTAGTETCQEFIRELKETGISFVVSSGQDSLPGLLQLDQPLVLLYPDYDTLASMNSQLPTLFSERDYPVFICSGDERWKQYLTEEVGYYLSANTHPLELARLLVEKLNLHPVTKQPAYAFSFFQF